MGIGRADVAYPGPRHRGWPAETARSARCTVTELDVCAGWLQPAQRLNDRAREAVFHCQLILGYGWIDESPGSEAIQPSANVRFGSKADISGRHRRGGKHRLPRSRLLDVMSAMKRTLVSCRF